MGGMQAHNGTAKLSDKLFRDSGDLYGRKTTDDKLTEIRDDCRNLCKNYENNSEESGKQLTKHEEEITQLKKEIDFLKQQITNGSTGKWGVYANKDEVSGTVDMLRQMMGLMKHDSDKLSSKVEAVTAGCVIAKPTVNESQPNLCAPKEQIPNGWLKMGDLLDHLNNLSAKGKLPKIDSSYLVRGSINGLYKRLHIVRRSGSSSNVVPTKFGRLGGYVLNSPTDHDTIYNIEKCKELLEACSTLAGLNKTYNDFDAEFAKIQGDE